MHTEEELRRGEETLAKAKEMAASLLNSDMEKQDILTTATVLAAVVIKKLVPEDRQGGALEIFLTGVATMLFTSDLDDHLEDMPPEKSALN